MSQSWTKRLPGASAALIISVLPCAAASAGEPGRVADSSTSDDTRPQTTSRVTFTCPGGARLIAEFVTTDPHAPAVVRPPAGPAVSLPAQMSGSGYRYADATHELRGKGSEVTWTAGAAPPITCASSQ